MPEARTETARLLVVDDNKVNRLLLTRSLELQGHRVAMAENGRVALDMADGIAVPFQHALQHILEQERAVVADVLVVVNRRSAGIQADGSRR